MYYLRRFDWILFGGFFFLAIASLVTLYGMQGNFFSRQLVWYAIAFPLIILGSRINWKWLVGREWFRHGIYWLSVLALVATYFQPHTVRGTKSWIVFGSFQFETSELAKIALIVMFAGFFARRHIEAWVGKNIFLSFLYTLIPTALVAIQPDLGTAAILLLIWMGFLLISGVHMKRLIIGGIIAILLASLMWFSFLEPYQKDRITGFLFSERDPLGTNYNVIQSKVAIGSSGFWGKGFQAGTQTRLGFLPEAQTDFIFAAFIEEWGIVGAFLILLTFILLMYRITRIGIQAQDNYSKFVSVGSALMFVAHFFINVGSNLGITPVTGITFPFFSYGGSSILTYALLMSILEHIKLESSR